MDRRKIVTLILAGKRLADTFAQEFGVENKAFIEIKQKTLIEHVVKSLKDANLPQPFLISVTSGQEELFREKLKGFDFDLIVNEDDSSAMTGIIKAVSIIQKEQGLLVTTADNPLLSPRIIDSFFENFDDSNCDFMVGVVNGKDKLIKKLPKVKRTWHKLNPDLWLSGTNLFYFSSQNLDVNAVDVLRKLEFYRKNPLAFCATLAKIDLVFLFKYLFKICSLEECNKESSKAIGLKTQLKIIKYPEACIDIDKMEDYELAEQIMDDPDKFFS
ncbi:MAG: NTP transferase domain-containing protein [Candidatus Caenarcaniphilales bacterium]|nr:NTP transferase domain-containing protein [Candidatus Caenarcaniphilales bacterium]